MRESTRGFSFGGDMEKLTVEFVREYLDYNPDTGEFTWIKNPGGNPISGQVAGYVRKSAKHGYREIKIGGKIHFAHNLAWLVMTGAWPTGDIDHINLVRHDNRWCNLREVSRSLNLHNSGPRKRNKSGHKGITFLPKGKRKWSARVMIDYKLHYIGVFHTLEEAITARDEFCTKMLGENYLKN